MSESMEQLHERTRQGKNICDGCGKPKEMYGRPWCPRCEKPEPYEETVLNLLQCIWHIAEMREDITREEIYELAIGFWGFDEWGNDRHVTWYAIDDEEREHYKADDLRFYDLMLATFDIPDGCLFYISW